MNCGSGCEPIPDDVLAEGSRPDGDPVESDSRWRAPRSEWRPNRIGAPKSETGVFPAIHLPAESPDIDEHQDASRTSAETAAQLQNVAGRAVPSVLIVEDSVDLAELIRVTLTRHKMQVAIETHGQDALERFVQVRPDVVLLDIGLPDMLGWKLLETFRAAEQTIGRSPAFIIITAYDDASNRLVGKLQNVHRYLVKPFTPAEVERAVISALGGRVS